MMHRVFLAMLIGLLSVVGWVVQPTATPAQAQEGSTCQFNLKVLAYRVLTDMGDGFLDGRMEVKVAISVSNGQLVIDRYDPVNDTVKLNENQVREVEGFIFSMPATETIVIEILAIEVDEFPTLFGVDIDQALIGFGNAIGSLGGAGEVIDGVIESGVSSLRDSIASDDQITDDVLILYADDWWNAGETQVYVTEDGNFELTYIVTITGCNPPRGA